MSEQTPAPESQPPRHPSPPPRQTKDAGIPWRMVAFGALAVYGALLLILNSDEVKLQFVFWSTKASLAILLLLTLAIGFLAGFLFDAARERRKKRRASAQAS